MTPNALRAKKKIQMGLLFDAVFTGIWLWITNKPCQVSLLHRMALGPNALISCSTHSHMCHTIINISYLKPNAFIIHSLVMQLFTIFGRDSLPDPWLSSTRSEGWQRKASSHRNQHRKKASTPEVRASIVKLRQFWNSTSLLKRCN